MATYQVTLKSEAHNLDTTISCPDDKFILEAAEDENIELPYSCKLLFQELHGMGVVPRVF